MGNKIKVVFSRSALGKFRVAQFEVGEKSPQWELQPVLSEMAPKKKQQSEATNEAPKEPSVKTEQPAQTSEAKWAAEKARSHYLVRFAYVMNLKYPNMDIKFIDALTGNKGGKDAVEIDERKGLIKSAAVYSELIKKMKDPTVTFSAAFQLEHDWVNNFAMSPKSKRIIHEPYDLDPDLLWTNDTETQSDARAMKALYNTFKSRVSILNTNLEASGSGNSEDLWHWADPHSSGKNTLHCGVVGKIIFSVERNLSAKTLEHSCSQ